MDDEEPESRRSSNVSNTSTLENVSRVGNLSQFPGSQYQMYNQGSSVMYNQGSSQQYYTAQQMQGSSQQYYTAQQVQGSSQQYYTAQQMQGSSQQYYSAQQVQGSSQQYYTAQQINPIQDIRETNGDYGVQMIYGALKSRKLTADKAPVGKMLKELDPEGHKLRSTHKIKRKEYKVSNYGLKDRPHLLFTFCILMATINLKNGVSMCMEALVNSQGKWYLFHIKINFFFLKHQTIILHKRCLILLLNLCLPMVFRFTLELITDKKIISSAITCTRNEETLDVWLKPLPAISELYAFGRMFLNESFFPFMISLKRWR
jgi:hypothetical protein